MQHKVLEDIQMELGSVYENLKAETLLAEIQQSTETTMDDFVISNRGTFSRAYRRDIIDVDDVLYGNRLTLNLSRNGLYDILPEGLFHKPQVNKEGESYTSRRKNVKEEEQNVRLLFAPLENEFFYQRLNIERKERELLDNFYNLKDDFLIQFWNLDTSIPRPYMLQLLQLLPHSSKISGDIELTRLCLEKVLDEKVSFELRYVDRNINGTDICIESSTVNFQLGVDSVLDGESYEVVVPKLVVGIGPISKEKANTYLKEGGVSKFIEAFYAYFLPMELEAETHINVKKDVGFLLDDTLPSRMGITTYL